MVDYIYCTHCDRTSDHGTYNDLVCRRCAIGASDVSVRLWDAGTGCGIYHRIGSAAGTDETDTLHASGQVKVNGQIWSAKTEEMSGFIAKDTVVMIQGIQGVKLIVKAKED